MKTAIAVMTIAAMVRMPIFSSDQANERVRGISGPLFFVLDPWSVPGLESLVLT